tara:strand:- start:5474 stop:7006 length:1533 start_codon:yes stop_codon:yes gene_type:complete
MALVIAFSLIRLEKAIMINSSKSPIIYFDYKPAFFLLAFPIGCMGLVQFCFAWLSLFTFRDNQASAFFIPSLVMLISAFILFYKFRQLDYSKVSPRIALLFASISWVVMGLLGAMPIINITHVSFTDGVFESISALTTTGATILSGLDDMPKSFLMYRQFLQWLGGLGIVIFVVAVLPLLNVGGMKLLKAETPGPMKDEKLTPRIQHAARYLWFIYVGATFLCALGYFIAGMGWFDAIAHSFTTISTGGFSTHDASMGYFQNRWIEINADIFMLVGAIAFGLHFKFIQTLNPKVYVNDEETKTFLIIVFILSSMLFVMLYKNNTVESAVDNIFQSIFHVISFITSTGYAAGDFTSWPAQTALLLVFAGYIGGCAGSTAGGNKVIRNILTIKIINKQLKILLHPHGVFNIKYNGKAIDDPVLHSTMVFMSIAATSTLFLTLAVMSTGLNFWTSLTAIASCINVLGPAYGELGSNFQPANDTATWIFSVSMILGRLEYFTVLVLFTKSFWKP